MNSSLSAHAWPSFAIRIHPALRFLKSSGRKPPDWQPSIESTVPHALCLWTMLVSTSASRAASPPPLSAALRQRLTLSTSCCRCRIRDEHPGVVVELLRIQAHGPLDWTQLLTAWRQQPKP